MVEYFLIVGGRKGNQVDIANVSNNTLLFQRKSACVSLLGSIQSHLFRHTLADIENKDTTAYLFKYVSFALQQSKKVGFLSKCSSLPLSIEIRI